jgi:phenylpropionate dioxygenase-like ring-hydroxylating dioxygenase large terminal subunit
MAPDPVDPILWHDWHPVGARCTLDPARVHRTVLLGVAISVAIDAAGHIAVARDDGAPLHSEERYGLVWVCLGDPAQGVLAIAEADEPDRPEIVVGAIAVNAAGPRVIENFLDLSHLGYVHAGYLGDDPHTRVTRYAVDPLPGGGIIATGCRMYQPQASPAATSGFDVEYVYKVERPLTVCLFKSNPLHRDRFDVIYLFVQPVTPTSSIAHPLLLCLPDGTTPAALRAFQQTIFMQDKPILENQMPKLMPLGDGAELPIAADRSSVAYRRWLAAIGLTWGVTPATAARAA